jgi:hypothetical protein
MKVNFEPVRDVLPVQRAVFPLADGDLADPLNAVALVDGEWVTLDADYKLERATTIGTPGDQPSANDRPFPVWNERGRTDVQALGERRTVVLWLGAWEFDTRIYEDTVVGSGAVFALGAPVKVATVTIGTRNYCGIVGSQDSDNAAGVYWVGFVTKLPADNGGKLRIRGGMGY